MISCVLGGDVAELPATFRASECVKFAVVDFWPILTSTPRSA
jgi:hypothetical protein